MCVVDLRLERVANVLITGFNIVILDKKTEIIRAFDSHVSKYDTFCRLEYKTSNSTQLQRYFPEALRTVKVSARLTRGN